MSDDIEFKDETLDVRFDIKAMEDDEKGDSEGLRKFEGCFSLL